MPEKTRDFENSTKVYFDHNASTPVAEEILAGLPLMARIWGNPSSIHWAGRGPKSLIREARASLAELLGGVSPLEIIFTSGGSESNSCVVRGIFDQHQQAQIGDKLVSRNEYITSQVEHPSVLKSFQWIEARGAKVHYLPVDRNGQIDLSQYRSLLSEKTALVSIMMANNETGVLFPIEEMLADAHRVGAYFHSDLVQALGKIPLNLKKLPLDYASFSAHKIYALKGTGVLFARKSCPVESLVLGGGQERHRRGGTENTLGIWALGLMAKKFLATQSSVEAQAIKMKELRDYFETRVLSEIALVKVTGQSANRLPNTSSLVLDGVDGEVLLMSLDLLGFAVSTGAACSSGSPEPSPVLLNMGLSRNEAQNSMRVSFGKDSKKEQVDLFIEALILTVRRLRAIADEEKKMGELNV